MLLSHIYLIGFVGDPSDLARLIPVIKKAEEDEVRREIADSKDKLRELFSISASFDGTSHSGECMNINIRYVTFNHEISKYFITQRLINVEIYKNPMNEFTLAMFIHGQLKAIGIDFADLLSIHCDRAAVNLAVWIVLLPYIMTC